jgi:Kelch motif/Galactose oxidase, central domain
LFTQAGTLMRQRTALLGPLAILLLALVPRPGSGQPVPDPRAHHELVYHEGDHRVYLIGGSTRRGAGHHYFDDMWFWNGAFWTQAASLPFPRSSHRVVYHAGRNSLILFGGGFGAAVRAEGVLWEWRAGVWRAIGGSAQAGASEPEMCYDRHRDRIVLFGGWDAANRYRGETWEWSGEDFLRVDSTGPAPRAGHALVFDPIRQRCLLFGGQGAEGYLADTWQWDGTAWHRLDVTGPSARWFFGSAANPATGGIVIFGGRGPDAPVRGRDGTGSFGDTWAWDGERWERLIAEGPRARMGAKLAFTGRSILLFGGREETPAGWSDLDDTWELRDGSWRPAAGEVPAQPPRPGN